MTNRTSEERLGTIKPTNQNEAIEITFQIIAEVDDNDKISGAKGLFVKKPSNFYSENSGSSGILLDTKTKTEYSVFISNDGFSFFRGYEKVIRLFKM